MLSSEEVEQVVSAYSGRRSLYLNFTDALVSLLKTLLASEGIENFSTSGRAKDLGSFRDKITRESKSYSDPLTEVTDLCGVRVVCYDSGTVAKIGKVIAENFLVDDANSIDKAKQLDPD